MEESRKILLVMPDERDVYKDANVKVGAFHLPSLAFAILGAIAKQKNFEPTILDLSIEDNPEEIFKSRLAELKPKYVGITCTSATYYQAIKIANWVKEVLPSVKVLVGGTHVSSLVDEALDNRCFDYVFVGEADISFGKFLEGMDPLEINGLAFVKSDGVKHFLPNKTFLFDYILNGLPFPDYSLYDLSKYKISKLHSRNNPVVWLETSRGCPFNCGICNKIVHGQTFRAKSVDRVIAEIKYLLGLGIKEFHIADDGFTSNLQRAEKICDRIIEEKLVFTWNCVNGIRVDRVTETLLKKMKAAGCYRISFGIESGNQKVLNNLGKRITLDLVRSSVKMAKAIGLEVFGFFIFGFEDDSPETMMDTINFAKSLPLDLAKASIMIPFPGAPLYYRYKSQNLLYPPGDYRNFNAYIPPRLIYKHPRLDWSVVEKYQEKFYRSFYFNPIYIVRRLRQSIKNGTIFNDIKAALQMKWYRKKYQEN